MNFIRAGRVMVNISNVEEIQRWRDGVISLRYVSGRTRVLMPSMAGEFEYDMVMRGIAVSDIENDDLPKYPALEEKAHIQELYG